MPIGNLRSLATQRATLRELEQLMLLQAPVLALPCQEGSGAAVADISGFGNDGAFGAGAAAPAWYQLESGLWVLRFDGDDYVDCGSSSILSPTDRLSIEAWVKLDVPYPIFPGAYSQPVVMKVTGGTWKPYVFYWDSSGKVMSRTENIDWESTETVWPADTWFHLIATTLNGVETYVYVNGAALPGTQNSPPDLKAVANSVTIGGDGIYGLHGYIALPRIYNGILSSAVAISHYNREKHYFGRKDASSILARVANTRTLAVLR